ncbi:leucine-rich_repeat domain-containing protein [Hexamita inflata]|uniref:Leucine-rich repeat domain-containing protein n=1 Tax=Hexamita inflata TaxID=28002 RepID=A0AA86Q684_9EUKA|nr:leucine-rich repeat domain-containing protein [Hexamita inflata]
MKHNHVIQSKEELLNHFGSSKQLEILDSEQMEKLLEMNFPPEVWKDALNRNLLFFNIEFVQKTKEFTFNYGQVKNIYFISFLTNLTALNLSENQISDISSISKLKNLKILNLGSNCIEDISALQYLPDLTHLYLQQNKLTSYTVALPNLVGLSLSNNKLQDKSGLQQSPKLQDLDLSGTNTTDLRTIPHQLFSLKDLDLSLNNLTDISHLSNFVDLQSLNLDYNNQLQNIEPLKFCTQLTELGISTTGVADIWPLQFMKNLKILQMVNTKVVDLHPLQHLYKLENIYAHSTRIIDVSPLSKLTQLNSLDFNGSKITNAETLQPHKFFSEYDFSDQEDPTTYELTFYNKIVSVHSSHEWIRIIQYEKSVPKFRASLASKKNYVSAMLNNQIMMMNKEVGMLVQFIQKFEYVFGLSKVIALQISFKVRELLKIYKLTTQFSISLTVSRFLITAPFNHSISSFHYYCKNTLLFKVQLCILIHCQLLFIKIFVFNQSNV